MTLTSMRVYTAGLKYLKIQPHNTISPHGPRFCLMTSDDFLGERKSGPGHGKPNAARVPTWSGQYLTV